MENDDNGFMERSEELYRTYTTFKNSINKKIHWRTDELANKWQNMNNLYNRSNYQFGYRLRDEFTAADMDALMGYLFMNNDSYLLILESMVKHLASQRDEYKKQLDNALKNVKPAEMQALQNKIKLFKVAFQSLLDDELNVDITPDHTPVPMSTATHSQSNWRQRVHIARGPFPEGTL